MQTHVADELLVFRKRVGLGEGSWERGTRELRQIFPTPKGGVMRLCRNSLLEKKGFSLKVCEFQGRVGRTCQRSSCLDVVQHFWPELTKMRSNSSMCLPS